jgi:hypothetical protein
MVMSSKCEFVGDVLALLMYSFHIGLGVAGWSVFLFCWCSSDHVGHRGCYLSCCASL